jgi:hypothetical protein
MSYEEKVYRRMLAKYPDEVQRRFFSWYGKPSLWELGYYG